LEITSYYCSFQFCSLPYFS